MADEPSESDNSSDAKQLGVFVGIAAAVVSVMVGINALTGFNLWHVLVPPKPTSSPPHRAPYFVAESRQWARPCDNGCTMSAIFRNIGGYGTAAATFHVMSGDGNEIERHAMAPGTDIWS